MEAHQYRAAALSSHEVVAHIDQKAIRLSALLRDIDNHPIELDAHLRSQLDDILEMLAVRIAATRALIGRGSLELKGAGSAA
jgi:hypothetical protein